jgi:signal peptidase II
MALNRTQIVWILAVFLVIVVADQTTKAVITNTIKQNSVHSSAHEGEFFWLVHQRNPGLVGGMFRNTRAVVFVAPLLAMGVLLYLLRHLDKSSRLQALAFGLVAGGAIGNMSDRLFRGEVVDFLQVHFHFIPFDFPWKLYPAFNVADSAICIGVFLLVVTWRDVKPEEHRDAADTA